MKTRGDKGESALSPDATKYPCTSLHTLYHKRAQSFATACSSRDENIFNGHVTIHAPLRNVNPVAKALPRQPVPSTRRGQHKSGPSSPAARIASQALALDNERKAKAPKQAFNRELLSPRIAGPTRGTTRGRFPASRR